MAIYKPQQPYILQTGKYEGKSLEEIFFIDSGQMQKYLFYMEQAPPENWNDMQKRISWLFRKASEKKPKHLCRFCNQRPVTRFSVRISDNGEDLDNPSFGMPYAFCDDDITCRSQIFTEASNGLVTFHNFDLKDLHRLIVILNSQKKVLDMFRTAYSLPEKLNAKTAFAFFRD